MKKIAINGFGRIGRTTLRNLLTKEDIEIVAINDLSSPEMIYQLLKFDSVYGKFQHALELVDGNLFIDGHQVKLLSERNPAELPWKEMGVDIVLDCTGLFKTYDAAYGHIEAGASKVLLSYPVADEKIKSIVIGVNDDTLTPDDKIISNASCTTNCTAPIIKILEDNYGIESGFLSTIHAYTADQNINDSAHKDFRRARAAALNIIPTSTGAASALGRIFPSLKGKIQGSAYRVPVITGSVIELTVRLKDTFTVEGIKDVVKRYSSNTMSGVLEYSEDELVSSDIVANPHSSIFDSKLTAESDGTLKIVSWYDNEFGYSNRMADLTKMVAEMPNAVEA